MINPKQLRDLVVIPVLSKLTPGVDITGAVQLMMGTAMQESRCGEFIAQVGGPALGVWQMEPATHDDIRMNSMSKDIAKDTPGWDAGVMVFNLRYSCMMARLLYRRVPVALPAANDIAGQAAYYKKYYNTPLGAATVEQYMANWRELEKLL